MPEAGAGLPPGSWQGLEQGPCGQVAVALGFPAYYIRPGAACVAQCCAVGQSVVGSVAQCRTVSSQQSLVWQSGLGRAAGQLWGRGGQREDSEGCQDGTGGQDRRWPE